MLQPLQQQAVKRIGNIRQNDDDIVGALCTHLPCNPVHLIAKLLNRLLDPLPPLFTYISAINDIDTVPTDTPASIATSLIVAIPVVLTSFPVFGFLYLLNLLFLGVFISIRTTLQLLEPHLHAA